MHIEQTKVNVMDQLINQWHCPDTAKNLICSILWLFFFLTKEIVPSDYRSNPVSLAVSGVGSALACC